MEEIEYGLSQGRKPAFNKGGGFRGFRSRPGAPMADPSTNIGALNTTPSSLTAGANWDAMFRNRITGETPSSLAAKRTGMPSLPTTNPVDLALREIGEDQIAPLSSFAKPHPSLDILAAGGPTHAQTWGGDSLAKKYSAFGANVTDTPALGGIKRTAKNKYGWGSSYLPT